MIPEGTILYPQRFDCCEMFFEEQPYAYWLDYAGEWVLYKEYNDYISVRNPNDCLSAISREELMQRFKEAPWFKDEEREKLCRTFKQRALGDNEYNFDDFEYEEI